MAKGMAILLSKGPSYGPRESEEENDGEDVADSLEFSEMFDAFCEAAGIKPKDAEAARRRLCALLSIHCSMKRY